MANLRPIGPNIWVIECPHRMMGMPIGTRSTLVRRADESLILISPGDFTDEIWSEIDALGRIDILIAPNLFHHLFLTAAAARAPSADIYVAKGLSSKVADLPVAAEIKDGRLAVLAPELHAITLEGTRTNETVFWHAQSKTLIVTDLVFHIQQGGLWTRFLMSLNGGFQRLGPTKIFLASIQDRDAFHASLQKVFAWDFDQIIMAHGMPIEKDGNDKLREAFGV